MGALRHWGVRRLTPPRFAAAPLAAGFALALAISFSPRASTQATAPKAAVPVATPLYHVPFEFGFNVEVKRGIGEESHSDIWNWNAIDFSPLEVGTPVHAMASGKVIFVKEDTAGSTGKVEDNNEVAIELADGSVNVYLHLMQDGATVAVGDIVMGGDRIGYSGNTGRSESPHLHIDRRDESRNGRSLPFRFAEAPAADGVLRKRDRVTSRNRLRVGALATLLELAESYELCVRLDARGVVASEMRRLADDEVAKKEVATLRRAEGRADLVDHFEAERVRLLDRWRSDGKRVLANVDSAIDVRSADDALLLARVALQDFNGSAIDAELRARVAALKAEATPNATDRPFLQQVRFQEALTGAITADRAAKRSAREGRKSDWKRVEKLYRAALEKGTGRTGIHLLEARLVELSKAQD